MNLNPDLIPSKTAGYAPDFRIQTGQITRTLTIVILFGLLTSCSQCSKESAALIPLENFFRNPEKTSFKLSPSGDYIAFMQPWQNRLNVFVQKTGTSMVTQLTNAAERDITGFGWASNNRLAYIQDKNGNENYHLFAVNIDGSNLKELTPFENVRVKIINYLEENDQEMIIQMNKRDPRYFDVYRINIETGGLKLIAENPGNISHWITDAKGRLRLAETTDGIFNSIRYREQENQPFRTVFTADFRQSLYPLFFSFDDSNVVYAASNINRDKASLVKYDLNQSRELDVIYQHPDVDVYELLYSKKKQSISGVKFTTDKIHYHFFDEDRKELQKFLQQRLSGYEIVVESMNRAEDRVLVRTYSDKSLGSYYFYDTASKELIKLADISPWLDENKMADMQPIKYKARDGLTITGYLTLPKGVEAKNLPVVINPHGGPWKRNVWEFNSEVQFLANRGYAVLQVNFRGSEGFGLEFLAKGFKQWGTGIQNDITDGVKWLMDKGIADPRRISIYGLSFGGYSALAGVAFNPDIYACAIDYAGPSDLSSYINSAPPYLEQYRKMLYEMIGDPQQDRELLEAASPILHVNRIRAPLFIAHGVNDPWVSKTDTDRLVKAMKDRGLEVVYMLKENEGHGFRNVENRLDFYRQMESFLAKHLGGRQEAP
jgi:dipeptidyl aminopeptidase/acylaminoacyl peptidase